MPQKTATGKKKGGAKGTPEDAPVRKTKVRDPQAWEEDGFPAMEERPVERARLDPAKLAEMRADAKKKLKELKGVDPATLPRSWEYSFTITGMENTTDKDWEVFLAVKMGTVSQNRARRGRLRQQFVYTKSYVVKSREKKQFKAMENIFSQKWEGSYKELQQNEVVVDVWMVSKSNFNRILGTAQKTLYDMASDSVFQTMMIKPNQASGTRSAFDIGVVYLNAVVSERFLFTIVASNWQFMPDEKFGVITGPRKLRIEMPTKNRGPTETFLSGVAEGPRYTWQKAGQYTYEGTRVSLSTEAVFIAVLDGDKIQGKAVIGLGGVGDYPIATGTLKQLSRNVENYVQGRVAGSLTVVSRSLKLKEGTHDEDSSVPPPEQPPDSLILSHLSPSMQYLVVEIAGAQGLPVADADYGSANALCRVKYDGNVQRSPVVMGSLSPTWNHTFYLPVRLIEDALREDPTFMRRLLPVEIQSKGPLEIEVWHWDSVPTEFLGSFSLDLHSLLHCRAQERALCDRAARSASSSAGSSAAVDSAEASVAMGVHPALSRKFSTKVFEGRREQLGGSWLQSATRATVSFDCYFLPDFPDSFKFPQQEKVASCTFEESYKRWDRTWGDFQEAYIAWFLEAPSSRRFLSRFVNAGGDENPLPRLIVPLALPASLAEPRLVIHWVRCTEFSAPPRQRSVGQISNWQRPEDMLALRRGSVQDHAVLLCCALIGLGKQAFVCKGTVQGGREHAWVMTREEKGTVTFWETTTGGKFHLPNRWHGGAPNSDAARKHVEQRWQAAKADQKWREKAEARRGLTRSEVLTSMDDLTRLPISPWKELYQDKNVGAVPYESVEVIFNNQQLWGNMGNHHPACIYYDMEDDRFGWLPLVVESERSALVAGGTVAVPVGPAMSKHMVAELQDVIEAEIRECVSFIRTRQGHESYFEDDEVLQETLEGYLTMLEKETKLESDWCYDQEDQVAKPWGAPSPFASERYKQRCRGEWSRHWKARKEMDEARVFLPVKENHVLSGIPLHISSTDLKEIRRNLLACGPIQEYFDLDMDDVLFFICAKVFPMASSVNSVWIFFGAEVPLSPEKIYELAQSDLQEQLQKDRRDSEWSVAQVKTHDFVNGTKSGDGAAVAKMMTTAQE